MNIVCTPEMIRSKLSNLDANKSPGHDKWHPHFLKELADEISEPLSILFNKSIEEGAHQSWKKAIITALHKKDPEENVGIIDRLA